MIGQKSQFTTGNSTVELLKSLNSWKVPKMENSTKMPKLAANQGFHKNGQTWATHHVLVHNAHTYNTRGCDRMCAHIIRTCIMRAPGCVLRCVHTCVHNGCVHYMCARTPNMCAPKCGCVCHVLCVVCTPAPNMCVLNPLLVAPQQ